MPLARFRGRAPEGKEREEGKGRKGGQGEEERGRPGFVKQIAATVFSVDLSFLLWFIIFGFTERPASSESSHEAFQRVYC